MSYHHSYPKRLNIMGCSIELAVFFPLLLAVVAATSSRQSVRLAGSPPNTTGINEGRIEVLDNGEWKDVCHRNWDQRDTGVVCRQLGLPGAAFAMVEAYYGSGTNNRSIQKFDCNGDEATLQECKFKVADKTCRDGETAGASCFLPGYLGCYLDRTVGSVLSDASLTSDDMTIRKCLQFCYDKGMRYAGLRENTGCYCGRNGTDYSSWGKVSDTNCMLHCGGNQAEVCGGKTTWFWTSSIYDIDLARCAKPKDPSYGFVKDRGALWYGIETTFGCLDGYRLDREETLTCVLGKENSELLLEGDYPTCLEIPDPSSRNKLDESNRIEAHAVFLKGATGTSTAEEASFMRIIMGIVVGLCVCLVIFVSIVVIYKKERKIKGSPKIKQQEEGNDNATGYHLANGTSSAADTKL
ncbi:uncharacterized protein LOC117305695 [Asterias rubens]|uniref:uncharacterized protein LOC117305695 n=1 Tax=Asterias rubens TaxID=7604 RepID=UPI001455D02C|nr:uncharacterized protein LOC117305695 [Asterias rubens]